MAADAGFQIEMKEFIRVEALSSPMLSSAIRRMLAQPEKVAIFTSKNAVRFFAEKYLTVPVKEDGWRIYCLENATRKAVEQYFPAACICGTAPYGADLADLILQKEPGNEMYFFCGDRRRDELPEKLRAHKKDLYELILYETVLSPQKVSEAWDGIIFFSPSAVHSFFTSNMLPPQTTCFAIGHATAAALAAHTDHKVVQSEGLTTEKMIQTIIHYYNPT